MCKKSGFALVEVLVALLILAMAFGSVIKATNVAIHHFEHVRNKSIATWVALQAIKSAQIDLIPVHEQTVDLWHHTKMLGLEWDWQLEVKPTTIPSIKKLTVKVYERPGHVELVSFDAPYLAGARQHG